MAVPSFSHLRFVACVPTSLLDRYPISEGYVYVAGNQKKIYEYLTLKALKSMLELHKVKFTTKIRKMGLLRLALKHECRCDPVYFVYMGKIARSPEVCRIKPIGVKCELELLMHSGFEFVDYVVENELRWYEPAQGYMRCETELSDLASCLDSTRYASVAEKYHRVSSSSHIGSSSLSMLRPQERTRWFSVFLMPSMLDDAAGFHASALTPVYDSSVTPATHHLISYCTEVDVEKLAGVSGNLVIQVTLDQVKEYLNRDMAISVARLHGIPLPAPAKPCEDDVIGSLMSHRCDICPSFYGVFQPKSLKFVNSAPNQAGRDNLSCDAGSNVTGSISEVCKEGAASFPPPALGKDIIESIIVGFCQSISAGSVEEGGCAVCGQLTPSSQLSSLKAVSGHLAMLDAPGVAATERKKSSNSPIPSDGIVLDRSCDRICEACRGCLRRSRVPKYALSRGLWIGSVPAKLRSLRTIEKMLIAKVRHNYCVATVASGHRKLKCNVVCFEMPIQKVYDILPPPVEDMAEVLAVIFSGPTFPTEREFSRTPFLVRKQEVRRALEWLKLNHSDYVSIGISEENLSRYPDSVPPVDVVFRHKETNKNNVDPSAHDQEDEDGVESGDCPFAVHGLTGDDLGNLTGKEMKGLAVAHWNAGHGVLRVGQGDTPQRTYKNPQLYPSMFPWLFPYGRGGIGSVRVSPSVHKKLLLMYHDKRFQTDEYFCFVAFNHEQYEETSLNSYLIAEKPGFGQVMDRILNINRTVLSDLATRMANGEVVNMFSAKDPEEKACFALLNDLDYVSGKSYGSLSSKKWMRNELWSLIAYKGAPMWYLTVNPVDVKHPLSMYYAGSRPDYDPSITLPYEDRVRLATKNPVACARFFDCIVRNFIGHVLGCDREDKVGLYGNSSAYYGVVEQQGRLSLHLHLLLWVDGGTNLEDVHRKMTDPDSTFSKRMIEYLESVHKGEFFQGDMGSVASSISQERLANTFADPALTVPEPPPSSCPASCSECDGCVSNKGWWRRFYRIVDKIVYLSNRHSCKSLYAKDGKWKRNSDAPRCLDNPYKRCKRRFPRPVRKHSTVNTDSGSIDLRHREPWLNTYSPVLSYVARCNTDVTSLRSGTAVKAVLLYVSNYITKVTLKTYVVFDILKSVFHKADSMLRGPGRNEDKAKSLLVKMVNAMSSRLEIGSPMAALYLLRGSDRYTDHDFTPFPWQGFVYEAVSTSGLTDGVDTDLQCEKAPIVSKKGKLSFRSRVDDYLNRGLELEDMCLYEWISRCKTSKIPKARVAESRAGGPNGIQDGQSDKDSASDPELDVQTTQLHCSLWTTTRSVHMLQGYRDADDYWMVCVPMRRRKVPNFIGRSLPRKDRGDRNYYCLTMLTFFRPWRSGRDLIAGHSTWQEAFDSFKFDADHVELMKNFNVRYECLDAKDDYFAQMKKGGDVAAGMPVDLDEDDEELVDDSNVPAHLSLLNDLFDPTDYESASHGFGPAGRINSRRQKAIDKTTDLLEKLGLSVCGPTHQPEVNTDSESSSDGKTGDSDDSMDDSEKGDCATADSWKKLLSSARKKELEMRSRASCSQQKHAGKHRSQRIFKGVDIIDISFMRRSSNAQSKEAEMVRKIIADKRLNEEQERAFTIIAQHAASPDSAQLRMYIGGVGGTGKSTVVRAVQAYFQNRGESHKCVVVAPTGNAASLLGGSTYHYVLGLALQSREGGSKMLGTVRDRLRDVEYMIIDEVSMLSCCDLDKIHRRLCEVTGNKMTPFGGINMVLCGDFAQLPPVVGRHLSALYSRTAGVDGSRITGQEQACGKAIWQQVYIVVILRKNMRQTDLSNEDVRFRRALSNMRYKACDALDVAFLRSKRHLPSKQGVTNPKGFPSKFRNVSVITAQHVDIDVFNEVGCRRYASEIGQALTRFYSDDEVPVDEESTANPARPKKASASARVRTNISDDMDFVWKALWSLPPSANDKNIPGYLDVFVGMPVMLQHNSATELGVTRGQEATVTGWIESRGRFGQPVLDVLFVKLRRKGRPVRIKGLPKNVVPLTRIKTYITVTLPDDTIVRVVRSQIEAIPNFGMTDFQSQGKTRENNVVHLKKLRDHFAYYTALSRGTTAGGTLILDDFDPDVVTGGDMDPSLKQEFRELELLDEITRLQFERQLPRGLCEGTDWVSLITAYQERMGKEYVPAAVHPAIRWHKDDPFMDFTHTWVDWSRRKKGKGDSTTEPDQAKCNESGTKRKSDSEVAQRHSPSKRCRYESPSVNIEPSSLWRPLGLSWDRNSCAYDAVLVILRNCWFDVSCASNAIVRASFPSMNQQYCSYLSDRFLSVGENCFETIRDEFRGRLELYDPVLFVSGHFASVNDILERLLGSSVPVTESLAGCRRCGRFGSRRGLGRTAHVLALPQHNGHQSLTGLINGGPGLSLDSCSTCGELLSCSFRFLCAPPIVTFDVSQRPIDPCQEITVSLPDGTPVTYTFKGAIYYGSSHFTCRFKASNGLIWFHDGLVTGPRVETGEPVSDWKECKGRVICTLWYSRVSV